MIFTTVTLVPCADDSDSGQPVATSGYLAIRVAHAHTTTLKVLYDKRKHRPSPSEAIARQPSRTNSVSPGLSAILMTPVGEPSGWQLPMEEQAHNRPGEDILLWNSDDVRFPAPCCGTAAARARRRGWVALMFVEQRVLALQKSASPVFRAELHQSAQHTQHTRLAFPANSRAGVEVSFQASLLHMRSSYTWAHLGGPPVVSFRVFLFVNGPGRGANRVHVHLRNKRRV
jgi:hypothetical protein